MGEDLRVVKTRRAIEGAMERLLAERPFDTITVQAILDEALVNRKTFYSHYRDKYDLVRKMADGFMEDIRALVEARKAVGKIPQGPFGGIDALYEQLLQKRGLALALWDVKTEGLDFSGELGTIVEASYLEYFGAEGAGDPALQAKLVSAMVVAMLRYKLEAGEPFTTADVHRELDVMHRYALGER
ncbi:MAG: TetR family transcriptional regulator [Coriobacteriaceae bacterium]|nr:TetR family transcriptional regulator [Coriobacteriaceae bacterium]